MANRVPSQVPHRGRGEEEGHARASKVAGLAEGPGDFCDGKLSALCLRIRIVRRGCPKAAESGHGGRQPNWSRRSQCEWGQRRTRAARSSAAVLAAPELLGLLDRQRLGLEWLGLDRQRAGSGAMREARSPGTPDAAHARWLIGSRSFLFLSSCARWGISSMLAFHATVAATLALVLFFALPETRAETAAPREATMH